MTKQPYVIIGYLLFIGYLLQYFLLPQWSILQEWQQDEMYRRWSGLTLLAIIIFQWLLTSIRMIRPNSLAAQNLLTLHQWLGALSPLFFYFHSMNLGVGYLLILSLIYYFNFLLGLLNIMVIKAMGTKVFRAWYLTHILGAFLILFIAFFHVWMVFYYE